MQAQCRCLVADHVLAISRPDLLPVCLRALTRMPADPAARPDITLAVERTADAGWPQGMHRAVDWYALGRQGYCVYFDPAGARLRLVLAPAPPVSAYWLQRDLFGVCACVTAEVLLHASAVMRRETAFLFCGPSGAGKTTMAAALAPAWPVVNDEVNWIRRSAGGWRLVNQRFWMGRDEVPMLRVGGVFVLQRSLSGSWIGPGLVPAESFARLLATHVAIVDNDPTLPRRCRMLKALVEEVPVRSFVSDGDPAAVRDCLERFDRGQHKN